MKKATTNAANADPKIALRIWARQLRGGLPDHSNAITEHLQALLKQLEVTRVLLYHALEGEPDLSSIAHHPDFEALTSRAHFKPTPRLTLHDWHSASVRSRIGLLEPPKDAPMVQPDSVQAVVLPALAFDKSGYRLGYGGGFYDRFLSDFAGYRIGVTASELLLEELPRQPHDIPMQFIVTELGSLRL